MLSMDKARRIKDRANSMGAKATAFGIFGDSANMVVLHYKGFSFMVDHCGELDFYNTTRREDLCGNMSIIEDVKAMINVGVNKLGW